MLKTLIRNRILFTVIIFAFLILSFSSIPFFMSYIILTTTLSDNNQEVEISIERGATAKRVATILHDNNLIKSKSLFLLSIKIVGKTNTIKAGKFKVRKNLNTLELINIITGKNSINITVPEGLTIEQIALLLEQQGIISSKKQFIESVDNVKIPFEVPQNRNISEGYLFPDTYNFVGNMVNSEILNIMLNRFKQKIDSLQIDFEKTKLSLDEIIIIASLVEKEAKVDDERPLIATVLLNRLKKRMKLNCDATVRYALKKYDAPLTKDDLLINSPYNTYLYYGLPPSPICNPGLKSIIAVINPSDADYLYYVSKGNGTHYFSKTLKEHNQAVKEFLRKNN